jgi:hypothetical protein
VAQRNVRGMAAVAARLEAQISDRQLVRVSPSAKLGRIHDALKYTSEGKRLI